MVVLYINLFWNIHELTKNWELENIIKLNMTLKIQGKRVKGLVF